MKDQKSLQYCLQEIERKLNWGESSTWKESEFLQLAEIISKESEISISAHTLKRLYGKLKYNAYYNPQRATKDALAKFLGFAGWMEFLTHYDDGINNIEQQEKQPLRKRKAFKTTLLISVGIVLCALIIFSVFKTNFGKEHKQTADFSFVIADSIGTVPFTVSTKYDVSKIHSDSIYLDFDFEHPITGPEIVQLDKQRSSYNYTYQIPGYYHISLKSEGQKLADKNVLAISQRWDSYFFPEDNQVLWIDKKIKASKRSGYLYYSPQDLHENGFDTKEVYFVDHRFFKDFEIDGDNFEMSARFKNSKETGGITCYDFVLTLFCKKNVTYFRLMERGCSGYSGIKLGKTELNGVDEDLTSLTFDHERWNILHVVVKEKNVQVFVNKELAFSENYQGMNGKIVGIEQMFKGAGMLDYIRIKDLDTQKVFFDDFD